MKRQTGQDVRTMAKDSKRTVTVHQVERLPQSVNGNPRWAITGSDDLGFDTFKTMSDAADAYSITSDNLNGKRVELTLTPAGNVRYFKIIEDSNYPEDW